MNLRSAVSSQNFIHWEITGGIKGPVKEILTRNDPQMIGVIPYAVMTRIDHYPS